MIRAKALHCDAWIPVAHCYEPEAAGNARLIAASLELLAALEAVQNYFGKLEEMQPGKNRGTEGTRIRAAVKTAIAKATGNT